MAFRSPFTAGYSLGVAGWMGWSSLPHCGYRWSLAVEVGLVLMSVVLEELTICVGDGCANRFPDETGWEGRCPECMALWDDHATGQHDLPVDGCLLCR